MQAADIPKNIARGRHEIELGDRHTLYVNGETYNEHCFATLFRQFRNHMFDNIHYLDEVFYLLDVNSNHFNHRALIADLQDLFGGYFTITMHLSGYKNYKWIKIVTKNNPPHWSFTWGGLYLMLTILREVDSRWKNMVWRFRANPEIRIDAKFDTWQDVMLAFTIKRPPYDVHDSFWGYQIEGKLEQHLKTYLKNIKLIWGTKHKWTKDSVIKMIDKRWHLNYQTAVYDFFAPLTRANDK